MEKRVTQMKWLKYSLLFILLLSTSLVAFWFFGAPMSAEASYKLAVRDVGVYASENNIDLSQYNNPNQVPQAAQSNYIFVWTPKNGGQPITALVDPMKVRVTVSTNKN